MGCCNKNKVSCCSSEEVHEIEKNPQTASVDDPEMIAMVATGAILITGFLVIAFVSGPLGLVVTLALLSALGLFYAVRG